MKKIFSRFFIVFILWLLGYGGFVASALSLRAMDVDTPTDVVVVLTGGEYRIEEGLRLFAEGKALHLFITGVHVDTNETDIVKRWRGDTALPPCCMTLGHEATTTYGNATETRLWLMGQDYDLIRLVTSAYHMPRALVEFNHALPDIQIIPHPPEKTGFELSNWYYWYLMMSEYHKTFIRWGILMFQERTPLKPDDPHAGHLSENQSL